MISKTYAAGQRLRAAGAAEQAQGMPDEATLRAELGHVFEAMEWNVSLSPLMSASTVLRDDRMMLATDIDLFLRAVQMPAWGRFVPHARPESPTRRRGARSSARAWTLLLGRGLDSTLLVTRAGLHTELVFYWLVAAIRRTLMFLLSNTLCISILEHLILDPSPSSAQPSCS